MDRHMSGSVIHVPRSQLCVNHGVSTCRTVSSLVFQDIGTEKALSDLQTQFVPYGVPSGKPVSEWLLVCIGSICLLRHILCLSLPHHARYLALHIMEFRGGVLTPMKTFPPIEKPFTGPAGDVCCPF